VILLGRHGAISWGEDLEEAYNGMERLEHIAQILKSAHELGGITTLPPAEVAALRKMRAEMGERTL
jgi:L-fuculose-phosphate aldolase